MKNKWFVWVLFTLVALAALELSGCATAEAATESTNKGNLGEHIRTPVKDFQSLGLVFTETRFETAKSGSDEGQIFTYQALLKDAQVLGADAIINVAIDKKIQVTTFPSNRITTWYGSALAIKYTDTLDLFNNHLNQPVIDYDTTNQSHSQGMSVVVMSPVWI
jgi:hypothetical protein